MGKRDHRSAVGEALTALGSADNPEEALRLVRVLREAAESLELELVRHARARKVSWSRIGSIYGLTKQGAQQRFRGGCAVARKGVLRIQHRDDTAGSVTLKSSCQPAVRPGSPLLNTVGASPRCPRGYR